MTAEPMVVVHDGNARSPYGRELAALLAGAGWPVVLRCPRDVAWLPDAVPAEAVLGGTRADGLARHTVRRLVGPLASVWRARHGVLLTPWVRDAWEALVFTVAARAGVVCVAVAHNPLPARARPGRAGAGEARYARAARVAVAHSPALARDAETLLGRPVRVAAHPPCPALLAALGDASPPAGPGADARPARPARVLALGALRADKGPDDLAAVAAALPRGTRLQVVGPGRLPGCVAAVAAATGVVLERSSDGFATDAEVVAAVRGADLLLAPYRAATASATVALALTAGLATVGYASGTLVDLLTPASVVPVGDAAALGALAASFLSAPWPTYAVSADELAAAARVQWSRALAAAAGCDPPGHGAPRGALVAGARA